MKMFLSLFLEFQRNDNVYTSFGHIFSEQSLYDTNAYPFLLFALSVINSGFFAYTVQEYCSSLHRVI